MTIYKLPSRSPRKYRGKYPTRVHNYGLGRTVHIELNNGKRFVCLPRDLEAGAFREGKPMAKLTRDDLFPNGWEIMAIADYAAVILLTRLFRVMRAYNTVGTCGLPSNYIAKGEF